MIDVKSMGEPIEVWLRQKNIAVKCQVVNEDESSYPWTIRSLNLRGAQREITHHLRNEGWSPMGRWRYTAGSSVAGFGECVRTFRH